MDRCVLDSDNGTLIIDVAGLWGNVGIISESGLNVNPENGLFVHMLTCYILLLLIMS